MKSLIDQFRRQCANHLAREAVPVHAPRGVLSLSFDDFPKSAWEVAGPMLEDYRIAATYYVAGGMCDGTNLGKVQYSVSDLQEVHAAGHEVECHTFSHTCILEMNAMMLEAEIDQNARWVAEHLDGHRMNQFAAPYGNITLMAKRVLGKHFDTSRGVRDGVNKGKADRNHLKAIGLESRRLPHYDLDALIEDTAINKGWLIAYGHDVESQPTDYGCTPEDLEKLILLAKKADLEIMPVGKAAHYVFGLNAPQS